MDKEKVLNFIISCRTSGKDPKKEADKRFLDVIKSLEVNTAPYRLAWSKPIGFYVMHTKEEAIRILQSVASTE